MKMYTYTVNELTRDLNLAKNALAVTLLEANAINEDQYKTITEDFAIIAAEKGLFGRTIARVLGWTSDDAIYFKGVQVNNINYNKEKKDVHQPEDSHQ